VHRCRSPAWGIVFGAVVGWWRQEVEWCSSSSSMVPGLGGMARRSLGDGRELMDSRRAGAPSRAMVVSIVGLVRGFTWIYHLESSWWKMEEVTSGDCAEGGISRLCWGVGVRGDRGTRSCV
jgi:hypothetical protein